MSPCLLPKVENIAIDDKMRKRHRKHIKKALLSSGKQALWQADFIAFFPIYLNAELINIILPNEAAESSSCLLLILSYINN